MFQEELVCMKSLLKYSNLEVQCLISELTKPHFITANFKYVCFELSSCPLKSLLKSLLSLHVPTGVGRTHRYANAGVHRYEVNLAIGTPNLQTDFKQKHSEGQSGYFPLKGGFFLFYVEKT